jgi:general secretion pathway protein G
MIELVFVIVVLGILASVVIPKMSAYVDDANLAKGKSTISAIRAAIQNERQRKLIKGIYAYPAHLDDAATETEHAELFNGDANTSILQYPVYAKQSSGGWWKTGADTYKYYITNSKSVTFTYNSTTGIFDCDHTDNDCKELAE